MIVGLYGQVGTGKSSVSKFLQEHDWFVINQDILGHEVLQEYPQEIAKLFGDDILTQGSVDRSKLGAKVFQHPEELSKLTGFSHPCIVSKTNTLIRHHRHKNIVIEGAFFCDVQEQIPHDELWYIHVDHDILHERLLKRGHTSAWIKQVLSNQQEILEHKKYAHFIINNNGSLEECIQQLKTKIANHTIQ